jgi:SpoVK/Ycf46/Vps4 family AAA+-type ATPase
VEENDRCHEDLVHLARLALGGRRQDVRMYIRRAARRHRERWPEVSRALEDLLREPASQSPVLRGASASPIPVDADTRLELLRIHEPLGLEPKPIYSPSVSDSLSELLKERTQLRALEKAGLDPSRSALFVGPPGVGKSLAARWLSQEMGLPLLTLDLSAVMSSFLGRTGNNLRYVLDYAKSVDAILLLDEFDAIGKRRDDATEIGELKRLVTVLLQEVDEWPSNGLLLAATNHPDLLDPAVWRRFDMVVEFPMPDPPLVREAVYRYLDGMVDHLSGWPEILGAVFAGYSFSIIEREMIRLRRALVIGDVSLDEAVMSVVGRHIGRMDHGERIDLAVNLVAAKGISQRMVSMATGVSRDTIRTRLRRKGVIDG